MGVDRAVICDRCHALFTTTEPAPYVGFDHFLDFHLDLIRSGEYGDIVLRDVAGQARLLIDGAGLEPSGAA